MFFPSTYRLALLLAVSTLPLYITGLPQRGRSAQSPPKSPLTARQVAQKVLPSVTYVEMEGSGGRPSCYGSGFFISSTEILTNKHVVTCSSIGRGQVHVAGSRQSHPTTTIVAWPDLDVALIEAEGLSAPPLPLGTNRKLSVGEDIFVAGNPAGLEGTFTRGIVSGIRSGDGLIQIDAPVSQGSSGGPVVDAYGVVIGITVSSIKEGQNLNFAIPVSSLTTPLGRMRRMLAEQRQKRAGGHGTASRARAAVVEAISPARKGWDEQQGWAKFVSSVVGDSVVKDELKTLLASGFDVNSKDRHGRTALHLAAMLGQSELLSYLLSRGADVNARDGLGRTPLMLAAILPGLKPSSAVTPWEGLWTESLCDSTETKIPFPKSTDDLWVWHLSSQAQKQAVQLLLKAGADARSRDIDGRTAIDHASASGPSGLDRPLLEVSKGDTSRLGLCKTGTKQLPSLHGFYLGMSLRDVLARFKGFTLPPADQCGRLTLRFNAAYGTLNEYALRPQEFEGVGSIYLTFFNGRLAFVQIFYHKSSWRSLDEYLAQISTVLHLPGKWRPAAPAGDWTKAHAMSCDGFKVIAGHASAPYVELHDTSALVGLLQGAMESQANKKRALEKDRERKGQVIRP